jgi:hypothetical protein
MSQNRLGIATLVLLVLLGLTLWRVKTRDVEVKAPPKLEVKLPKLERDKLDELELSSPEKPTVKLVKKGSEWRLSVPLDAKADQDAVKAALDKLAELEVTGIAATKPENHERLEVDAKKGTHLIASAGGKPVLDSWIGSYQSGNTMLRLEGQPLVATVKGSIRYAFNKAVREWRDRNIEKVETKDVREIVFDNKNGHFDFVRAGEDWNQVVDKRNKRDKSRIDPLDQSKVKGILGTASSLTATDFAEPTVTAEQAGLGTGAATVVLKLANDAGAQEIVYRIGSEKDQNYYLQREGVDTIFLVSKWIGERLIVSPEALIKKETPAAPNAGPPGSPHNPIPVEPIGSKIVDPTQAAAREALAKAAAAFKPTAPAKAPAPAKK